MTAESTFDLDHIEELCARFQDEGPNAFQHAFISRFSDNLHLTVLETDDSDNSTLIRIFIFQDDPELYKSMDKIVDGYTEFAVFSSGEFSILWNSFIEALSPFQIAAETAYR